MLKTLKTLLVSTIFADLNRNPRDPKMDYADCRPTEGYSREKFLAGDMKQGLFESIFENGVKTPIWVRWFTDEQVKTLGLPGNARIVKGHKRFVTVGEINQRFPDHIKSLECIVLEGITDAEEWEMMIDHGVVDKESPLSELGEYRAICNLHDAGFGQVKIGLMFGQAKGWAMRRIWCHQMGPTTPVEAHYIQRFDPDIPVGSYYNFPMSVLDSWHKLWTQDRADGLDPMDPTAGFRKSWDSFGEKGRKAVVKPRAMTRAEIEEREDHVKGRPALEEAVKFAKGDGGSLKQAADMYDKLADKAGRADMLATELELATEGYEACSADRDVLYKEHQTLKFEFQELTSAYAALKADLAETQTECTRLRTENASLTEALRLARTEPSKQGQNANAKRK